MKVVGVSLLIAFIAAAIGCMHVWGGLTHPNEPIGSSPLPVSLASATEVGVASGGDQVANGSGGYVVMSSSGGASTGVVRNVSGWTVYVSVQGNINSAK